MGFEMQDQTKYKPAASYEDKAAKTLGRLVGRSSLKQQDLLAKLGFPREKSVGMTMYAAHKKIDALLAKAKAP